MQQTKASRDFDARLVELVATGEARSRGDLARVLGVAPSTVSTRVQALIDDGLLAHEGEGVSRGGRRPQLLRVGDDSGRVLTADFGAEHVRVGMVDLRGTIVARDSFSVDVKKGPVASLDALAGGFERLTGEADVRGIGVALPGPVDVETGCVNRPSRMPGWQGFSVSDWLNQRFGVPTLVDNDANLMALGEHRARFGRTGSSITVKIGSAIGSGLIVAGQIYRGATNAAGDITHTKITAAGDRLCACGNTGCLETVASGVGLVQQLAERSVAVASTADVVRLARDGDPTVASLVRSAGVCLGQVLSAIVNFFNPTALLLTGSLSTTDMLLAVIRSEIYQGCYSLATEQLCIEPTVTGADAGLLGAAHLVIDHLMPHRADASGRVG